MQPQKLAPTTEVRCGLQKFSTFSEKRAKTLTIFFFIFLNFFGNFDETKQGKAEFGSGPNGVKKLLKKFQIFRINERKVMPVFPKVSQGIFSGRHNTAAAVRAKRPETLTPITGSSL